MDGIRNSKWYPPGVLLFFFAFLVASLLIRFWLLTIGSAMVLFLIAIGPPVSDWIASLVKRSGARRPLVLLSLSYAQRLAVSAIPLAPFGIWRILAGSWVTAAIMGPIMVFYAVWFLIVLRREGWSGDRRTDG